MGLRASHFGPYPFLATHSRASHSPISTPTDGPISSHGSLLSKHGQNTASCARKSTNWSPLSSHDAHLVGNVGQPRGEGRQTHVSFPFGWPQKGIWTLKASHETQPYPISYWEVAIPLWVINSHHNHSYIIHTESVGRGPYIYIYLCKHKPINRGICSMAHLIWHVQVTELVPPSLAMWGLLSRRWSCGRMWVWPPDVSMEKIHWNIRRIICCTGWYWSLSTTPQLSLKFPKPIVKEFRLKPWTWHKMLKPKCSDRWWETQVFQPFI